MANLPRIDYDESCEVAINQQINTMLFASYIYLAMGYYFNRNDVALRGFSSFFKRMSYEKLDHAEKFMEYQNKRGGRIVLQDVKRPDRLEWDHAIDALQDALEIEELNYKKLQHVHQAAERKSDYQLSRYVENDFLFGIVESLKKLADLVTRHKRVGDGLGEYILDRDLEVLQGYQEPKGFDHMRPEEWRPHCSQTHDAWGGGA